MQTQDSSNGPTTQTEIKVNANVEVTIARLKEAIGYLESGVKKPAESRDEFFSNALTSIDQARISASSAAHAGPTPVFFIGPTLFFIALVWLAYNSRRKLTNAFNGFVQVTRERRVVFLLWGSLVEVLLIGLVVEGTDFSEMFRGHLDWASYACLFVLTFAVVAYFMLQYSQLVASDEWDAKIADLNQQHAMELSQVRQDLTAQIDAFRRKYTSSKFVLYFWLGMVNGYVSIVTSMISWLERDQAGTRIISCQKLTCNSELLLLSQTWRSKLAPAFLVTMLALHAFE